MVKAVEKKRVTNTKAAALGGGRGSDWEGKEKIHLGAMAAVRGSRGRRRGTLPTPQGEREGEEGRFEICLVV
jgi:hypothetical protein